MFLRKPYFSSDVANFFGEQNIQHIQMQHSRQNIIYAKKNVLLKNIYIAINYRNSSVEANA